MLNENCLLVTVDVEDWYHIPSVCGSPFSVYGDVDDFFKNWESRYDYLQKPTERVLDLLDRFDIRATFFIVADVAEHYPGLVESIVDRGHEIACHGLHHNCKIHPQTKKAIMNGEEFEVRTLQAKKILENISHEKVIGYRSPNALIGGWMLDILERLGFKYDSSVCVNSLYNKTDSSLEGVSSVPYYPLKSQLLAGGNRNFIEFPWSYLETLGFKVPTSGGPILRFMGAHVILRGLKQSLKRGHSVFYFHPIDISSEKFPQIGKGRPFYWLGKGSINEKRIEYVLKNLHKFKKATLGECCGENV